jgi:hypothetical protein
VSSCQKDSKIRCRGFPVPTLTLISKVCVEGDTTKPVYNESNVSRRKVSLAYVTELFIVPPMKPDLGSGEIVGFKTRH